MLDPEVVEAALELALGDLCAPESASVTNRDHLHTELQRLDVELKRYAEAIADAGPLASVLTAIKVREQRRDAIRAELAARVTPGRTAKIDRRAVRRRSGPGSNSGGTWCATMSREGDGC